MKIQTTSKILLLLTALFFMRPENSWGIDYSKLSFESVTRVEQGHNPGVGANHVDLVIEGRAGGQPASATITLAVSNIGAYDTLNACKKDAMLAMHYPERYSFDITSGALPGSTIKIYIANDGAEYVICSLKKKIILNIPASNLNNAIPAVPLSN